LIDADIAPAASGLIDDANDGLFAFMGAEVHLDGSHLIAGPAGR
jgi:hypothetical protein